MGLVRTQTNLVRNVPFFCSVTAINILRKLTVDQPLSVDDANNLV